MLKGLYTAIVTPFLPSDELDEEGLRQNIRYQYAHGAHGITALGSTGESVALTAQERTRVIKIAREESLPGTLIVGTGSNSTRQTIYNTCEAADLGADYALIITPYYNRPMQTGIYEHFAAIAKASSLPIIVYNNPGRTAQNMVPETFLRMSELPQVVGIKETSGNVMQVAQIFEMIRNKAPHLSLLAGDDYMIPPLFAMGAQAVISPCANVIPREMRQLVDLWISGDWEHARAYYYQLLPLLTSLFCETNPIAVKAAMNFVGMAAGECRLPLTPLSAVNQKPLFDCLSAFTQTVNV